MDASDRQLLANIERHDCAVLCIEDDADGPSFAFSVGLFQRFAHPEILVSGLTTPVAQHMINTCRDRIREGAVLRPGFSYGALTPASEHRFAMRVLHVDHYEGYLGTARWLYSGDEFPCLQAFWPDAAGRFPWDTGCDAAAAMRQPRLDQPWAFRGEPIGRRIWLDRRALTGDAVIRIDRLEESDWRFSCDPDANAVYGRQPLWRALQLDSTLSVAANLPIKGTARRTSADAPWVPR